MRSIDITVALI